MARGAHIWHHQEQALYKETDQFPKAPSYLCQQGAAPSSTCVPDCVPALQRPWLQDNFAGVCLAALQRPT